MIYYIYNILYIYNLNSCDPQFVKLSWRIPSGVTPRWSPAIASALRGFCNANFALLSSYSVLAIQDLGNLWRIYGESRFLFSFSESNAPIPFTVAPWRIDYRHILFDFIPEMAPSMIPNMCNPPTQPWFLGVLNFSGIRLYIHYPISNVGHFDIVHFFGTQRQPFHLWNFGTIMKNTMCLGHSISICCLKITETHPIPS